jgi:hypothetical protein
MRTATRPRLIAPPPRRVERSDLERYGESVDRVIETVHPDLGGEVSYRVDGAFGGECPEDTAETRNRSLFACVAPRYGQELVVSVFELAPRNPDLEGRRNMRRAQLRMRMQVQLKSHVPGGVPEVPRLVTGLTAARQIDPCRCLSQRACVLKKERLNVRWRPDKEELWGQWVIRTRRGSDKLNVGVPISL